MLSSINRINKLVIKKYYSQFGILVFFIDNGILLLLFLMKYYDVNLKVHYLYI